MGNEEFVWAGTFIGRRAGGRAGAQWILNKSHHRPRRGSDFPLFIYIYTSAAHNSNNQIPAGGQFEKAAAVPIFSIRFFYTSLSFSGALSFQEETAQSARPLSAYDGRVCVYTFMLDSICFCVPLQCSWMRLLYHSPLSLCQQAVRLIIYGVGGASSKVCGNTRRWLWRGFALVQSWAFRAPAALVWPINIKTLETPSKRD